MKKKMLAAAIASALAVPSAFAAIDDAGMKYTSASEGFYGSFRFALASGEDNDLSTGVEGTRLGVQGDVDVGHGYTAFYRLEWEYDYNVGSFRPNQTQVPGPDGEPVTVSSGDNAFRARLGYAGLKGKFGSARVGRIWSADYDYVTSLTDVTNNVTGNLAPRFRISNAIRYDSPDIQGFNFSIQLHANDGVAPEVEEVEAEAFSAPTPATFDFSAGDEMDTLGVNVANFAEYNLRSEAEQLAFRNANSIDENAASTGFVNRDGQAEVVAVAPRDEDSDDGNEIDQYILAAGYNIRGVNLAATYVNSQAADQSGQEDETSWGLGGTYGQDNWKVGYVYWDTSDYRKGSGDDLTGHSIAGQVSFDKVTLRAVFDTQEFEPAGGGSADTDAFTLEAQYSFSSKARAYATYQNVDTEEGGAGFFGTAGGESESDSDLFYVAYRVDF